MNSLSFFRAYLLCVLWLLIQSVRVYSQDTTFVNKHHFNSLARNIFYAENDLYVRTDDALYRYADTNWEPIDLVFEKMYVFYNDGFYDSDFIPNIHVADISSMLKLIPQDSYNEWD